MFLDDCAFKLGLNPPSPEGLANSVVVGVWNDEDKLENRAILFLKLYRTLTEGLVLFKILFPDSLPFDNK